MTSKIIIKNTSDADSRTADGNLTKEKLYDATVAHIHDVERGMDYFARQLHERGLKHDYTKLDDFDNYTEIVLARLPQDEFEATDWCQRHYFEERHHVNSNAPTDVDLVDIFEHVCDVTLAGLGRAGHVSSKYSDIDPGLLYRAYWNTIRRLESIVEVSNAEYLNIQNAKENPEDKDLVFDEKTGEWLRRIKKA